MTQPVVETQPLPELADWLAIQHQGEQQKVADKTAAGLALLWGALRFDRLDEATPAWLHGVTLQVEQQFRDSEQAAFDFVQGSKWAVEPLSKPLVKIETSFPTRDFQVAMRATGPVAVKQATKRAVTPPVRDSGALLLDAPPEPAITDLDALVDDLLGFGKVNSTGVGVKFALNGGRGEVQQLVLRDARTRREPIGWARFTEDSLNGPCYFCALLAARGPVYYNQDSFSRSSDKIREFKSPVPRDENRDYLAELLGRLDAKSGSVVRRAFVGDGPAKVHDHCRCQMRPVYREQDGLDARAKFFERQWEKAPRGVDWKDSINEFRKVYRRPPPYSERPGVSLRSMRRNRDAVAEALGERSPNVKWWDRKIRELEKLS